MALKNRDGTVFRLAAPNPIVEQQFWPDPNILVFHNFTWKGEVIPAQETKPVRKIFLETVVIPDTSQVLEPESEPETELEPQRPPPESNEVPLPANTVVVHCLPFIGWTWKEDSLYGDRYKVPQFGSKFTFEALIVERGDLAIALWASSTFENDGQIVKSIDWLKPNSVIYPARRNDGSKLREYRWWKIQTVEPLDQGVTILGVITDIQPSFSG